MMRNQIICGDALTELQKLPDGVIDTVITSPPYFNLRDYKVEGQIGLETSKYEYVRKLVSVFMEVNRVLKPTGSLWVNIADSYNDKKSLSLIPEIFAIDMTECGWILRNDIIWKKGNCMPSSVKNRFTIDFEHLFFFTKSNKPLFWVNDLTHTSTSHKPAGTRGIEGYDWDWEDDKKVSHWVGHDYYFETQYEPYIQHNRFIGDIIPGTCYSFLLCKKCETIIVGK